MNYLDAKKLSIVYAKYGYVFIAYNEMEDFEINVTQVVGESLNFNVETIIVGNYDTILPLISLFEQMNFSTSINETVVLNALFETINTANITINEHEYYDLNPSFIVNDAVNIVIDEEEQIVNLAFNVDVSDVVALQSLETITFNFSIDMNVSNVFPISVLILEAFSELLNVDIGDVSGVVLYSHLTTGDNFTLTIQNANSENITIIETDISNLTASFSQFNAENFFLNIIETLDIDYKANVDVGSGLSLVASIQDIETLIINIEAIFSDVLSYYDNFYLSDLDDSTLAQLDKE